MPEMRGMDPDVFSMVLDTISKLERDRISLETKLEMDRIGDFPMELIRFLLSPEVALHLIFIPEEYGGLGAGAGQISLFTERMSKLDLSLATVLLAICLGMDPIRVGATPDQKEKYLKKIAKEGLIAAYGVTEPEAGSNVQALKTKAERILDNGGTIKGYRINGQKQFITNGGVADIYTILADTPEGPSFFIVEAGAEGLTPGKHEDKHGLRASDTCPLSLEDLYVPVENLVGGVEGQGLKQANQVFGYTRLMVANFGLGGGMAALEKAISYSKERVQFGTTLSEKQGYTHKLLVPNAVRLEAARAHIEKVALGLDSGEADLQVEGSIAKYFSTEAGDKMANDGIQALGGYGYIREYEVEKIKRDIKITTIFEGTSEIQRNIISMFRLRETVRSKGKYYLEMAEGLEKLKEECGAGFMSEAIRMLNDVILHSRRLKLSRSQYVMFLLADMIAWCEVGEAMCQKAAHYAGKERTPEFMRSVARLFAGETMEKVYLNGLNIAYGCNQQVEELAEKLQAMSMGRVMRHHLQDMDMVARELVK